MTKSKCNREKIIGKMDNYHKNMLDVAKKKYIKQKNQDFSILVVGSKGSGKSTWAMQSAAYWDKDFNIENGLVYQPNDFFTALKETDKKAAIVLDEAILQVFSRKAMSKSNVSTIQLFDIIRIKQHFLELCVPRLKRIDWDIIEQLNGLIFIDDRKEHKTGKRYWRWYLKKQVKKIYYKVTKEKKSQEQAFDEVMSYRYGAFPSIMPFKEQYDKLKWKGVQQQILESKDDIDNQDILKNKNIRNRAIKFFWDMIQNLDLDVQQRDLAKGFKLNYTTVNKIIHDKR